MHLLAQYQEQEAKARLALKTIDECSAAMKEIRARMIKAGLQDPEGIFCLYGTEAGKRAREAVDLSADSKDRWARYAAQQSRHQQT